MLAPRRSAPAGSATLTARIPSALISSGSLRLVTHAAYAALHVAVRVLLVSQMYPGPADPDLGVFVRQLEDALAARGHVVERAVLDRRGGGKRKYLTLSAATLRAAR